MDLIRRGELRLAVVTGLCTGLVSVSPITYGYYMPMAVVAVMASSYGGSFRLGLQRLQGSLLGAVILVVCQGLTLPLPLALAIALGLTRLIGGFLGLEVGYKVAGFVVVMGWLAHDATLSTWVPLRLIWTGLGVLAGLWAMRMIWPSRAIEQRHRASASLLRQMAAELRQQALRLDPLPLDPLPPEPGSRSLGPDQRRDLHRQELGALMALRRSLPEAVTELGPNPESQPLKRFWSHLDSTLSVLLGVLDSLRNLSPPLHGMAALDEVHGAERALLLRLAERLTRWAEVLPRAQLSRSDADRPLEGALAALRRSEDALFARPIPDLGPTRERQIAQRLMLCHQAAGAVEAMERRWLELDP